MPIRTPIGLDSGLHLVEMNPGKFYALIKLAKSIDKTSEAPGIKDDEVHVRPV